MKILVFYHNDLDGKCSAAIVKKALGDHEYKFIPMGYTHGVNLPDNINEYWRVYIVDFTMEQKIMEELETLFEPCNVIWIDHHITSIDQWGERFKKFEGIREDGTAASLLTWRYFFGEDEPPKAVQYISDRDLWYFKLDGTRRFHEYMLNQNFKIDSVEWDYYLSPSAKLTDELFQGTIMRESRMKGIIKDVKYLGYKSELDGYKCMKVNYSSFESVSDMGHYICEELGYDVAWIYYQKMTKNGLIQINNLRSKSEVDVSEIAKKRGGGGHRQSAGFSFPIE